jgi:quercetin dioxygenase-like cupin family protein
MKVVRRSDTSDEVATAPIFVGTVYRRSLIDAATSPAMTVTLVSFVDGARNLRHVHSADQILYITEGMGIVASEERENLVTAGDIVHVAAGEVHWHGAAPGASMAHLSILPPCETEVVEKQG